MLIRERLCLFDVYINLKNCSEFLYQPSAELALDHTLLIVFSRLRQDVNDCVDWIFYRDVKRVAEKQRRCLCNFLYFKKKKEHDEDLSRRFYVFQAKNRIIAQIYASV